MAREDIPLFIPDLSAFSKNLRKGLQEAETFPGHLAMLGLIARSAGYRNYQTLKADHDRSPSLPPPDPRALRVFDENGIMTRWPKQTGVQELCLWVLWNCIPSRRDLSEAQVNDILRASHGFGDHALLRRSLVSHKLMQRTKDGRVYRRIEQKPPDAARDLIRALNTRTN